MTKKISQREARRLLKQVRSFEERDRHRADAWHRDYPGGINIISVDVNAEIATCIWTAQRLGHPIVAKMDGDNRLKIFGLPAKS